MKKDSIQTRNRKMTTKSKKGRKFSHESDYSKTMMGMDMKYGNFASQHMGPVTPLMTPSQHLQTYSPYTGASFPTNFAQSHNMSSYPSWTSAAQTGFAIA